MAGEKKKDEEPSIEEILDSIRQIISDDDAPQEAPAADSGDDDIIELTNAIDEDVVPVEPASFDAFLREDPQPESPPAAPEPPPAPQPPPKEIVIDMTPAEDDIFEEKPADPPPPPSPAPAFKADDMEVLTRTAQKAAFDGFAELARKTAVSSNGPTLEDIVRNELNPLLREWLDRHLPSIIERLVSEELDRIAKRAMEE